MGWIITIGIIWFFIAMVDSVNRNQHRLRKPTRHNEHDISANNRLQEKPTTPAKSSSSVKEAVRDVQPSGRPRTTLLEEQTEKPQSPRPTISQTPPRQVTSIKGKRTYESALVSTFRSYGIHALWHMTHVDNVFSITQKGVVSHLRAKPINRVDISDPEVQKWRTGNDPIFNRELHAYSPTYIAIRNPMLYRLKNNVHELCILEISLESLDYHDVLFTDGNAASRDTKFYTHPEDLKNLPWDVLKAEFWSDFADGKRKRCAEVLVYPSIGARHITKIHCNSFDTVNVLEQSGVRNVLYSPQLFFG